MIERSQVESVVRRALEEYNLGQPEDSRIDLDSRPVLVGAQGVLDSMGLVNVVVALEELVEQQFGTRLTLADERAFSQHKSPFRDLETLADFVLTRLQEGGA